MKQNSLLHSIFASSLLHLVCVGLFVVSLHSCTESSTRVSRPQFKEIQATVVSKEDLQSYRNEIRKRQEEHRHLEELEKHNLAAQKKLQDEKERKLSLTKQLERKEAAERKRKELEQSRKDLAEKEEAFRLAKDQKLKGQLKKEEAARKQKLAEEQKRKEETARKQKLAEEQKRKEETARKQKLAEEQKRKEETARKQKLAEEQKRKEETARKQKLAEEQKRKEETARKQKLAEEQKRKEETRILRMRKKSLEIQTVKYIKTLTDKISRLWIEPANSKKGECVIDLRLDGQGNITDLNISKCSGDALYRNSVENAVWKANPFPLPGDMEVFDPDIQIVFNPP